MKTHVNHRIDLNIIANKRKDDETKTKSIHHGCLAIASSMSDEILENDGTNCNLVPKEKGMNENPFQDVLSVDRKHDEALKHHDQEHEKDVEQETQLHGKKGQRNDIIDGKTKDCETKTQNNE